MASNKKRRGARVETEISTVFSSDREEGSGILAEISYSGARLRDTSHSPPVGARVSLFVWLPRQPEPFELKGHLVRQTDDGFAIEYDKPSQEICDCVDAVAAGIGERGDTGQTGDTPAESEPTRSANMTDLNELDLSLYSLRELKDHAARLEKAIESKRMETRDRLRDEMVRMAEREGLTLEEVMSQAGLGES